MKKTLILISFILICFNGFSQQGGDVIEENFPVFRGCNENKSSKEIKKCTTRKVSNFIKMSFDLELADKLFPLEKSTQFEVSFVINNKGKAEQITAKAHKREIAAEAIKIVKRLPKFKKPGFVDGEAVDVPFSLLITIYFD